jgi:putative PIN family toxin of toxin-antitoxin system
LIEKPSRVIIDTNIFLSAILNQDSFPARVVEKAILSSQILQSAETWAELEDVLNREKFDRYRSIFDRRMYFQYLAEFMHEISVLTKVSVCRDPKDDKLLELAIDGRADLIITGDKDLLALSPFEGIPIITPLAYLQL